MDVVERLGAGKCPECSGWGEVAHFGEMVACKCNGRYERPISMEERAEAAETILALRQEVETLRAVLQKIADRPTHEGGCFYNNKFSVLEAREALKGAAHQGAREP